VALTVAESMGEQYPELRDRRDLVATVAEQEEVRFRQTIERGLGLLEERFEKMTSEGRTVLGGADAFQLYDTYGFPVDLTQVICAERGYGVDEAGYAAALEEARSRSEFHGKEQAVEGVYRDALGRVPDGAVRFVGYERNQERGAVLALIHAGALVDQVVAGTEVEAVVGSTPFYGESGGQVGDRGTLETASGLIDVADTQRPLPGLVVHRGTVRAGEVTVGSEARLSIDIENRDRTRRNHSATHLLHLALRLVLGAHVQQKGSLVGPDRLRFDFTHGRALTSDEVRAIEDHVNRRILSNVPIQTEVLGIEAARSQGAMMIFEEKYGDVVRMLTIADSVELCGGTHARATGDIGLFKIVGEQGIAAGVRRLLATTGDNSLGYLRDLEGRLDRAARVAKSTGGDLAEKIEKLFARERLLEKQVEDLQKKLLSGAGSGGVDELVGRAREISGVRVLGLRTEVTDRGALRELAEQLRDKLGGAVVLVASVVDGKAQLVLTVSKEWVGRCKAGDLIRPLAEIVGGSGGGRPDMAQAGGTEVGRLDEAIEALYGRVEAALGAHAASAST
jgi:alanyl-tRNA synthetase